MTDAEILQALDLRDSGMTAREISRRMRTSLGTINGALYRVERDTRDTDDGNQNGTMPTDWWRAGIEARP